MRQSIRTLRNWIKRNETLLSGGSLIIGFVIDNLTLSRIDRLFENLMLIIYTLVVGVGIFALHYLSTKTTRKPTAERTYLILPFIIQFAFGGLFSGFTIFYSRSGSLGASWIFILILVGLMLGTEIFRKHYERVALQLTEYFLAIFFFAIFAIPILTGEMGPHVFIASGLISLVFISIYTFFLARIIPQGIKRSRKYFIPAILVLYGLMHLLYFTNIIPPIPLSLKVGETAYSVVRISEGYTITREHEKEHLLWIFPKKDIVRLKEGQTLYVFSSVFAPTKIKTNIVHHWQWYNPTTKEWESEGHLSFPIAGGNARGYRGYSYKSDLVPGSWRVDVETPRGQVIGRVRFEIDRVSISPELTEIYF